MKPIKDDRNVVIDEDNDIEVYRYDEQVEIEINNFMCSFRLCLDVDHARKLAHIINEICDNIEKYPTNYN